MKVGRLTYDKSKWKTRVATAMRKVDRICMRFNSGEHIGMGVLYESARKIAHLGEEGGLIRARVNPTTVKRVSVVAEGIAVVCVLLENASHALYHIVDTQGTPMINFPLYTSDLRAQSTIDTSSLEALNLVMKEARDNDV